MMNFYRFFRDLKAGVIVRTQIVGGICLVCLGLLSTSIIAADLGGKSDASIVDEAADELIIEESESDDSLVIEDEMEKPGDEDSLIIEEESEAASTEGEMESLDELVIEIEGSTELAQAPMKMIPPEEEGSIKIDEVWAEYATIPNSSSAASGQLYVHTKATGNWRPNNNWEFQLSGRIDGYEQFGGASLGDLRVDYDESFVRYRTDQLRLTIGAQKIIWGRIDEAPPTDRMSTQDFGRYIVDDLADRRRANSAIRYEHFFQNHKLDLVYLPRFRAAELPDQESIWYPVNRQSGEIIGIKSTPTNAVLIKSAPIEDDAPTSDGGFGARFSGQNSGLDYALTIQKSRQSIPYYAFNSARGILEAKYPRSWVVGGDFGFEAMDATWRFEAAWFSDTPITAVSGQYSTTKSVSWGGGVEFFPGDGDARLTIQLTGQNLINASDILDRREIYLINGSFEVPFAGNQWRAKARFYLGIDERDIYFNPELAYTGWDSQEIYIEGHYFDGAEGTPGGFHQDNSLIALGWRIKF